MPYTFHTPNTVVYGPDAFDEVGRVVRTFGRRCLIVVGQSAMVEQGWLEKAEKLIHAAGAQSVVLHGVRHDPSVKQVDEARTVFKRSKADVVMGLGGGSVIDVAKAVAGLAREKAPTVEFLEGRELRGTDVPIVAAPSTFGTGSEATTAVVLSDRDRKLKKSFRHPTTLPACAVVDARLGAGAPQSVTAASGMDALVQAIEAHLSRHATSITRAFSLQAVRLLMKGLPASYDDGDDLEARDLCAQGSLMAGMAFVNSRLGIVHGLAHPLGARYDLIHGEVCATLLPYALRVNREVTGPYYAELETVMGGDPAEVAEQLLDRFNLPRGLAHANISESDYAVIAEQALPSGSTQANPRRLDKDEIAELVAGVCRR